MSWWCEIPDNMEDEDVEGYGSGRYWNVPSQTHDLGKFIVATNHVTIFRDTPNEAHVTWVLLAKSEQGVDGAGRDVSFRFFYSIDPTTGIHSFTGTNKDQFMEKLNRLGLEHDFDLLLDDVVDLENELRSYSDELMTSFAEELHKANR